MARTKNYYTQVEVDEYVRKLLTDSEITLSRQSERLEAERKENLRLVKDLEESRKNEKSTTRLLVLSERKVKYLENETRSRCSKEIERLAKLAEMIVEKKEECNSEEEYKIVLEGIRNEVSNSLDTLLELAGMFGDNPMSGEEQEHASKINQFNIIKDKKKSELEGRFERLKKEFDMKIGENATRGRGRPKKSDENNITSIERKLKKDGKVATAVYPPVGDSGFDFEEALNPTDSLEDIMKDLLD